MLLFPAIDPVAVTLGSLQIHWYGLAYLTGISLGWWILNRRAGGAPELWSRENVSDIVFYAALGAVLGGRVGYVLFYNFSEYMHDPLALFQVWRGGMSFHGGVIGFISAMALYARRFGRGFFEVVDFVVPVVPIGLFFGRIANFVNQELWGAPSNLPWAVLFTDPLAGGVARHPTQLYEAGLEGIVLFLLLNRIWSRQPPRGVGAGTFLLAYGVFRCAVEFVREPDRQLGYLNGTWLTMGQVLSIPMILTGLILILVGQARRLR